MFNFFKKLFGPRLISCYPIYDMHKVVLVATYSDGSVFVSDLRNDTWHPALAKVEKFKPSQGATL